MPLQNYLQFRVEGIPVPQGSFRHVGNGRIIAANPKLNTWRQSVADQVAQISPVRLIDAPTRVDLIFTLPKPKSVTKRLQPTVKPDIDKLARAVLDAISLPKFTQLLKDDSIVVDLHVFKRYESQHVQAGVRIMITW